MRKRERERGIKDGRKSVGGKLRRDKMKVREKDNKKCEGGKSNEKKQKERDGSKR